MHSRSVDCSGQVESQSLGYYLLSPIAGGSKIMPWSARACRRSSDFYTLSSTYHAQCYRFSFCEEAQRVKWACEIKRATQDSLKYSKIDVVSFALTPRKFGRIHVEVSSSLPQRFSSLYMNRKSAFTVFICKEDKNIGWKPRQTSIKDDGPCYGPTVLWIHTVGYSTKESSFVRGWKTVVAW